MLKKSNGIIYVLVIAETKFNKSFPVSQFWILTFASSLHLGRDQHGEGAMVYIRENIPAKFLSTDTEPMEGLYTELNFHKRKWLLSCSNNPNKKNIMNNLDALQRNLDLYLSEYQDVILLSILSRTL